MMQVLHILCNVQFMTHEDDKAEALEHEMVVREPEIEKKQSSMSALDSESVRRFGEIYVRLIFSCDFDSQAGTVDLKESGSTWRSKFKSEAKDSCE
ncbi:hypothetical protein Bca101_042952 [Brassica carinata]